MAVNNRSSAAITARDATPPTMSDPYTNQLAKSAIGMIEAVNGDSIGSIYRICQIPSSAYVRDVLLSSDDIGTTTIADIGVYYNTATSSGAVIDADFFGSAVSLKDGALSRSNVTHESGAYDIDDLEKPLWQALGLSSDPNCMLDIAATLTAAADAGGTIVIESRYV